MTLRHFIFGFLTAILLIASFVLVMQLPWPRSHADIVMFRLIDAKFELATGPCKDVYIVGDSAGNGLDQDYITAQSGKPTLNLALNGNSGRLAYQAVLDRVIAQGCKPKLVIVYLAPTWFFADLGERGTFDAFYTLLKFAGAGEALSYTAKHPRVAALLAPTLLRKMSWTATDYRQPQFYNTAKRTDFGPPVGKKCGDNALTYGKDFDKFLAWRDMMRERYPTTRIAFVAAPMATCYAAADVMKQIDSVTDQPFATLPNDHFIDYVHLSNKGSKPASDRVARIIRKQIRH